MKILVTGSAGFLASWLIPHLRSNGHEVVGLDKRPERISDRSYLIDLTQSLDFLSKSEPIESFDACIHLACDVGGFLWNATAVDLEAHELLMLQNIKTYFGGTRPGSFIFTSSINVFETSGVLEEAKLTSRDQSTPYAKAKALCENFIEENFESFSILRPTNFFGAGQTRSHSEYGKSHVIPELIHKIENLDVVDIFGDGTQVRNFIHASDVVALIERALGLSGKNYFHLRSNIFLSIQALAETLMKLKGVQKPLRFHPEYMKYEPHPIWEFPICSAEAMGWKTNVRELSTNGLSTFN